MCGVWGFVTQERMRGDGQRLKFVKQAAVVGSLRGTDSAGMILVPHNDERGADWCKSVGTGEEFINSDVVTKRLTLNTMRNFRAIIGHNRSATVGVVNLDNAHPFQEGPITLVHNGTLHTTYQLPTPGHKLKDKAEVDSHIITHNLATHTTDEVLSSLHGAFTLLWHDQRDDCVYMARNSQRPLHLMKVADENTVLFASEADMLWWLAGRNGFKRTPVQSLDTGVLLKWAPGALAPSARRFEEAKYETGYECYGTGWQHRSRNTGGNSPGKSVALAAELPAAGAGTSKKMRSELALLGFSPTDSLDFSVTSLVDAPGTTTTIINGWAYYMNDTGHADQIQAIVYGVNVNVASKHKNADWVVRPVGVRRFLRDEKDKIGTEVLICRPMRITGASGVSSGGSVSYTRREYKGPGGRLVDSGDWMILTSGGCIQCGKVLTTSDADEILWVADDSRPMCGECASVWTSPTAESAMA